MALLALLGVSSLPQFLKSPESGGKPASAEPKATAAAASESDAAGAEEPHVRDLQPLLDYLSEGDDRQVKQKELASFLRERLCHTNVHCLIITLPDPVESVASGRFDESLDIVQRAIELQGYILDRTLLPWKSSSAGTTDAADRSTNVEIPFIKTPITVRTATTQKRKESRPGLMVFKHLVNRGPAAPVSAKPPPLLLTFVVPESPISGMQKPAFLASLNLIDIYFRPHLSYEGQFGLYPRELGARRVLHIIAPSFNGSQRSLETSIAGWKAAERRQLSLSSDLRGCLHDREIPAGEHLRHRLAAQAHLQVDGARSPRPQGCDS